MKFIKFLIQFKIIKRLLDSLVKNYFLVRKIYTLFLKHRNLILEINMQDSYDRVFIFKGYWEEEQIDYLLSYAESKNCDFFVDVGSNFGLYSLVFAKQNSKIKILSYEPIKKTYDKQIRNINLNDLQKNIESYNLGLSNQNKSTHFETKTSYNYKQSSTYKVSNKGDQINKLIVFDDQFNISNKKLIIKIDVEGHEKEVLEGMKKTINLNSILLQVEIFNENYSKINSFLLKEGFKFLKKINSDYYYEKNIN